MAPVLEIANILESAHGLAFEVQIKSPSGANLVSPARARLESYAGLSTLPRLLRATAELQHEAAAPASPEGKKARAVEHCRRVEERVCRCLSRRAATASDRRRRLSESLCRKEAAREAGLAVVRAKACRHNEAVARRLRELREQAQVHAQGLRQKLGVDAPSTPTTDEDRRAQTPARKGGRPSPLEDAITPPLTPLESARSLKAREHNEAVARKLGEHRRCEEDRRSTPPRPQACSPPPTPTRASKAREHNEAVLRNLAERRRAEPFRAPRPVAQACRPPRPSRADKARAHNEAVARTCAEQRRAGPQRAERSAPAERPAERREAARAHNEAVARTCEEQRLARLPRAAPSAPAARPGRPMQRREAARRHNDAVARNVESQRRGAADRAFELQQRLDCRLRRAASVRRASKFQSRGRELVGRPAGETWPAVERSLTALAPAADRRDKARLRNLEVARKVLAHREACRCSIEGLRERLARPVACAGTASAEKARQHNFDVARRRARQRQALVERLEALRQRVAAGNSPVAAATSTKVQEARRHNDIVASRLLQHQQACVERALSLRVKLLPPMPAPTRARASWARRHNERVARQQEQHREAASERAAALRQRVAERAREVALFTSPATERGLVAKRHNEAVADVLAQRGASVPSRAPRMARSILLQPSAVALRQAKARRHNEAVACTSEGQRQMRVENVAALRGRLAMKSGSLRTLAMMGRALHAARHNELVAERMEDALRAQGRQTQGKLDRKAPNGCADADAEPGASETAADAAAPIEQPAGGRRMARHGFAGAMLLIGTLLNCGC